MSNFPINDMPVTRPPLEHLLHALEDFIEKKIAAESEVIRFGCSSEYLDTHVCISRSELREALETLTSK